MGTWRRWMLLGVPGTTASAFMSGRGTTAVERGVGALKVVGVMVLVGSAGGS
jgi:hypothetical protein